MLLLSAMGMAGCMAALGLYYHCHINNIWLWGLSQTNWEWIGFIALCLFMFFNQVGLGPLATVVGLEIVPAEHRGTAMGLATAGGGIVGAASSYSLLPLGATVGYEKIFWG